MVAPTGVEPSQWGPGSSRPLPNNLDFRGIPQVWTPGQSRVNPAISSLSVRQSLDGQMSRQYMGINDGRDGTE